MLRDVASALFGTVVAGLLRGATALPLLSDRRRRRLRMSLFRRRRALRGGSALIGRVRLDSERARATVTASLAGFAALDADFAAAVAAFERPRPRAIGVVGRAAAALGPAIAGLGANPELVVFVADRGAGVAAAVARLVAGEATGAALIVSFDGGGLPSGLPAAAERLVVAAIAGDLDPDECRDFADLVTRALMPKRVVIAGSPPALAAARRRARVLGGLMDFEVMIDAATSAADLADLGEWGAAVSRLWLVDVPFDGVLAETMTWPRCPELVAA